jgi:TATA-box binding protein (TBP) (component of TFIID and TFIIIB)
MSGNQGVQLIMKSGKKLLIGSQRPDELASAIDSIVRSSQSEGARQQQ